MQVNSALYYYDYKHVHTFGASPSATGRQLGERVRGARRGDDRLRYRRAVAGEPTDYVGRDGQLHAQRIHRRLHDDRPVQSRSVPRSLFDPDATPFNIKGNQMLRVPEYKADAYAQYAWPVPGDRGTVTALVDYSYIDNVYFDVFENRQRPGAALQPHRRAHTWLSADTTGPLPPSATTSLTISAFVRSKRADESQDFRRGGTLTNPRTVGLEVLYKFGAFK